MTGHHTEPPSGPLLPLGETGREGAWAECRGTSGHNPEIKASLLVFKPHSEMFPHYDFLFSSKLKGRLREGSGQRSSQWQAHPSLVTPSELVSTVPPAPGPRPCLPGVGARATGAHHPQPPPGVCSHLCAIASCRAQAYMSESLQGVKVVMLPRATHIAAETSWRQHTHLFL